MQRTVLRTALAALAGILLVAPNAGARTMDEIIKSGVIKVGVNPNLPPMSSLNTKGELEGFDIDIANIIAQRLGVKAEFITQESPQRVPNVVNDVTDISLGVTTRTTDRLKVVDFSVPLHTESMATLLVDSPKVANVKKWQDLNREDITLADVRGVIGVQFAAKNLPKAKMLQVESSAEVIRAMAQGRADALVENIGFFMAHTKNYPDVKWKVLPETIQHTYDGVVMKKGTDLRLWLNALLFELHGGGGTENVIAGLWEKWWGQPMLDPVEVSPFF